MTDDEARPLAVEVPELIDEIKGLKESYDAEREVAEKQRRDDRVRRRWNRILGALLGLAVAGIFAILVQEEMERSRDKDDRDAARQLIRDSERTLEVLLAYQDPNSEIVQRSKRDQAAVITGLVAAIREGVREDLAAVLRCQDQSDDEDELSACLLAELPLAAMPSQSPTPTPDVADED